MTAAKKRPMRPWLEDWFSGDAPALFGFDRGEGLEALDRIRLTKRQKRQAARVRRRERARARAVWDARIAHAIATTPESAPGLVNVNEFLKRCLPYD